MSSVRPSALMRAACAASALAGLAVGACGGGSGRPAAASKTTTTTARSAAAAGTGPGATASTAPQPIPNCLPTPAGHGLPPWLPADLPMPPGTVFVEEVATPGPAKVGRFVVAMTIPEFVRFALAEYPKAGWRLGRGDSEPGEAEDGFSRGASGGAWRVRESLCETTKSELFMTYATNLSNVPPSVPSTTAAPPSTATTTRP